MKHGSHRPAGDVLSDVRSQFERWRKSRTRGTRIPAALWQAAVEAAGESGVSKTAQELRRDGGGERPHRLSEAAVLRYDRSLNRTR